VIKLGDQYKYHTYQKKMKKKKLKQTNASARPIQCRFKIREGRPGGIRMTMDLYGGKDL